jgi:transcriptional regulator with XRE-family HTH domain
MTGAPLSKEASRELRSRLVVLRNRRGVVRSEMAERVGVPATTLDCWEHGTAVPSLAELLAVARALDVDVAVLVRGLDLL